ATLHHAHALRWHADCVGDIRAGPSRQICSDSIASTESLARRTGFLAREQGMLHYAVVFFVIALIAALFGFGGIAAGAVEIAKVLFFIFLVLFIVSLVL